MYPFSLPARHVATCTRRRFRIWSPESCRCH
ncbi:hypothetical protein DN412_36790 [Cupriavidus lacunae]|uniref:Uncharacterized protein n=1 Tax=Cupriavidus lacunae TaxID=2666307 RepID=A0A370NIR3_9BURK|nr:hypothetical protein DN412_36790 [Cupriavidus lacunae]